MFSLQLYFTMWSDHAFPPTKENKTFLFPFKILFCGGAWKSIDSRPRTTALLTLLISAASCSRHLLICVLRKVWSRDYVYKTQQSMALICDQLLLSNSLLITWSSLSTVLCGILSPGVSTSFPQYLKKAVCHSRGAQIAFLFPSWLPTFMKHAERRHTRDLSISVKLNCSWPEFQNDEGGSHEMPKKWPMFYLQICQAKNGLLYFQIQKNKTGMISCQAVCVACVKQSTEQE